MSFGYYPRNAASGRRGQQLKHVAVMLRPLVWGPRRADLEEHPTHPDGNLGSHHDGR